MEIILIGLVFRLQKMLSETPTYKIAIIRTLQQLKLAENIRIR